MVPRTGRPNRWLVEPVSTAGFTKRALVEMKEREKILIGKEKKTLADRKLQVSLDRADAIIEGAPHVDFTCGAFGNTGTDRQFPSSFSSQSKTTGSVPACCQVFKNAKRAPAICAARKGGTSVGRIPAKVGSLWRVAAPLFLGGLPFAPLFHANGGSLFSGSVLSTHHPLLTIHHSLASMDLLID